MSITRQLTVAIDFQSILFPILFLVTNISSTRRKRFIQVWNNM